MTQNNKISQHAMNDLYDATNMYRNQLEAVNHRLMDIKIRLLGGMHTATGTIAQSTAAPSTGIIAEIEREQQLLGKEISTIFETISQLEQL